MLRHKKYLPILGISRLIKKFYFIGIFIDFLYSIVMLKTYIDVVVIARFVLHTKNNSQLKEENDNNKTLLYGNIFWEDIVVLHSLHAFARFACFYSLWNNIIILWHDQLEIWYECVYWKCRKVICRWQKTLVIYTIYR